MEEKEKPKKAEKTFSFVRLKKKLNPKPPKEKKVVRYKDLIPIEGVKPKPGMTENQLKRYNKFMQVKEGETHEQWQKRTRRYRVVEDEEAQALPAMNKYRIRYRKKEKSRREYQNSWHRDQSKLRDHNYLKYYGVVMNFFSIKYNIRKDYLEMFMFFYENDPFTRSRFENAAVLICGSSKDVFKIFSHMGYIYQMVTYDIDDKNNEVAHELGLYKLNNNTVRMITTIYKVISMEKVISMHSQPALSVMSKDEKSIFMEMNQEINEIMTGKKPTSEIE